MTASQSSDKEVSRRAKAAVEKVRESFSDEQLQFRGEDVIHTRDCVLTGRIAASALKAQTQKFGELTFKLADLRAVYSMATSTAEVSVEAAPFAAATDKWHDTGIEVEAGMGLVLNAGGKVDLVPQQPGVFVSGPEGSVQAGVNNFGMVMGTLMGRIGEKGENFVIGKRDEGKAASSGKLFVFIVPTQNGQAPSGAYKLKATAGFSLAVNPSKNQVGAGNGPRVGMPGFLAPPMGIGLPPAEAVARARLRRRSQSKKSAGLATAVPPTV